MQLEKENNNNNNKRHKNSLRLTFLAAKVGVSKRENNTRTYKFETPMVSDLKYKPGIFSSKRSSLEEMRMRTLSCTGSISLFLPFDMRHFRCPELKFFMATISGWIDYIE